MESSVHVTNCQNYQEPVKNKTLYRYQARTPDVLTIELISHNVFICVCSNLLNVNSIVISNQIKLYTINTFKFIFVGNTTMPQQS